MYGMPRAQGCARAACVSFALPLRMYGMPRAQGCAGAACVSFALRLSSRLGAKVVWCPASGHAVNPSMGARPRPPVSYGPETGHHTPSAMGYSYSDGF